MSYRRLMFAAVAFTMVWGAPAPAAVNDPVDIDSDAPAPCRWVALETREATVGESALLEKNPLLRQPDNPRYVPGLNGAIAMIQMDAKQLGHLVLLDTATGSSREVLPGSPPASMPRWSPDGKLLACTIWMARHRPWVLLVVDPATGALLHPDVGGYSSHYAWSPDGRSIITAGMDSIGIVMHRVDVASGRSRVLFRAPYRSEFDDLSWSPDSRTIATTVISRRDADDERTDIWVVDVDGGVCNVTFTPNIKESHARWLDDTHIVYEVKVEQGIVSRVRTLERRAVEQ
jgi:WD40 repeat protein